MKTSWAFFSILYFVHLMVVLAHKSNSPSFLLPTVLCSVTSWLLFYCFWQVSEFQKKTGLPKNLLSISEMLDNMLPVKTYLVALMHCLHETLLPAVSQKRVGGALAKCKCKRYGLVFPL